MKILFVSLGYKIFEGLDCGASNRSTMFVEALSKVASVDVISFCDEPVKSNIDNCKVIGCYKHHRVSESIDNWFKIVDYLNTFIRPLSPYTYFKRDKEIEHIVDDAIRKGSYDYVACRYINHAIASGLHKYSDRLIIDVDDNPVSACLSNISTSRHRWGILKLMKYLRAYSVGYMSKHFLSKVYKSYYSNINEPPCKNSTFLPNITTIDKEIPDISESTPYHVLFVGWLDFLPNKIGIQYFVNNVFPIVKNALPKVVLRIAGKTGDANLLEALNSIEGVEALGFVDDISEEYSNCRVVIIPVYQGSGTSVKFVEAAAMNRPIVSTPEGRRGYESVFSKDVHYMEASDENDFASKIITLLQSVEKSVNMARASYAIGKQFFSKDSFCDIIKESIPPSQF